MSCGDIKANKEKGRLGEQAALLLCVGEWVVVCSLQRERQPIPYDRLYNVVLFCVRHSANATFRMTMGKLCRLQRRVK